MTDKISIAARLGGRGKKAGRVQANIRVLPETWAEVKRQAEARGITPGELIEAVFRLPADARSAIEEMMTEKVWRK